MCNFCLIALRYWRHPISLIYCCLCTAGYLVLFPALQCLCGHMCVLVPFLDLVQHETIHFQSLIPSIEYVVPDMPDLEAVVIPVVPVPVPVTVIKVEY